MYEGDSTVITLGRLRKEIEVTSGIRQGCCISTLLFKMITYTIIDDLREKGEKYKVGKFFENSLWLADDATLIAKNLPDLMELLKILEESGGENGLRINKEKTKIMKIRGKEDEETTGDYERVKETKYLGIQIGGKGRNLFEMENKKTLKKAEEKANILMATIKKSADKVIVGKAAWKQRDIPAILFGRAVIPTCETLAENLQKQENRI